MTYCLYNTCSYTLHDIVVLETQLLSISTSILSLACVRYIYTLLTIGHEVLVQLVHEAHENGLICYVSAGIEDKHVPDAVVTGVDGIGIGNSPWFSTKYYYPTHFHKTVSKMAQRVTCTPNITHDIVQ